MELLSKDIQQIVGLSLKNHLTMKVMRAAFETLRSSYDVSRGLV